MVLGGERQVERDRDPGKVSSTPASRTTKTRGTLGQGRGGSAFVPVESPGKPSKQNGPLSREKIWQQNVRTRPERCYWGRREARLLSKELIPNGEGWANRFLASGL